MEAFFEEKNLITAAKIFALVAAGYVVGRNTAEMGKPEHIQVINRYVAEQETLIQERARISHEHSMLEQQGLKVMPSWKEKVGFNEAVQKFNENLNDSIAKDRLQQVPPFGGVTPMPKK